MKKFISTLLTVIGILFWIVGLTAETGDDLLMYVLVNIAFCVIGSVLLWAAIKINPETIRHHIQEDDDAVCTEELEPMSDWDKCYLIAIEDRRNKDE